MVIQKLLKLRKIIKSKRPTLRRQDSHKKSAIKKSGWRKPRGLQNKVRLGKKGYVKGQRQGYRSPVSVRGLSKEGLKSVVVSNLKELENINPKLQSVIVSSKVGAKKKAVILEKAKELKLIVENLKVEDALKKIKDEVKARKDEKKQREVKKAKSKATLDEKAKTESVKKEKTEVSEKKEDLSEEEVKKQAEAEKQKILIKKQA